MSALLALWLLAAPGDPAGARAASQPAPQVYQLALAAAKQDYFLPAPRRRRVLFKLDARQAPPKARLMFRSPLPAGKLHLHFQVTGVTADHTLVVAVPLTSGRSTVTVRIDGPGRYDFGFWTGDRVGRRRVPRPSPVAGGSGPSEGPERDDVKAPVKEYRFTVEGPLESRTFDLDLP